MRTWNDLPGPPGIPVLGNAHQITMESTHAEWEEWVRQYGDICRFRLGSRRAILVAEPELIEEGLRRRPDAFSRAPQTREIFAEAGLSSVFSEEGPSWKLMRRLVVHALSRRKLADVFPMIRELTDRLLRRWESAANDGRVIDPMAEIRLFTTDVMSRLTLATETNALKGEDSWLLERLAPLSPMMWKRLVAAVPYWRVMKLPADRRFDRGVAEIQEWVSQVLEEYRAEVRDDPSRADDPQNFIQAMATARDEDGEPYSDEVIFANATMALFAAQDATANTVAWATHLLLDAPEAYAKMQAEIDAVLGDAEIADSIEATSKLDFVDAVVNEALRLKPSNPHIGLGAVEDTTLGDIALEKGTTVVMMTRMPATDDRYVDRAAEFEPERWFEQGAVARMQNNGIYNPFGSGPRMCPGKKLALLQVRLLMSMLYRNFEVERVGAADDVREKFVFVMNPDGLRVRLHRRAAN